MRSKFLIYPALYSHFVQIDNRGRMGTFIERGLTLTLNFRSSPPVNMDQIHKYPRYSQCFDIPLTILAAFICYQFELIDVTYSKEFSDRIKDGIQKDLLRFIPYALVFITMFTGILKIGIVAYDWKFKTEDLEKCKRDYAIGIVVIYLISMYPLILMFLPITHIGVSYF